MQNPQILELIENLKGRRNYEEKKASKLGFNSLYAYFENKLLQEKNALEESARELEIVKAEEKLCNLVHPGKPTTNYKKQKTTKN